MKKYILLGFTALFISCKSTYQIKNYKEIVLEKHSIRTFEIVEDTLWFGSNKGRIGKVSVSLNQAEIIETKITTSEIRSSAFNGNDVFFFNIESPAYLMKYNRKEKEISVVFKDENKEAFYDATYIKDGKGISFGDPTNGCFTLLKSYNNGESWQKIECSDKLKNFDGEAAFAASNSNVEIFNNDFYFVSGGAKSRFIKMSNSGKIIKVVNLPIVQGKAMQGAFSMDFYNKNTGIVAGGDYEKQDQNFRNKAITTNGGETWQLVGEKLGPGYVSCVQFVPKSSAKVIVTCGGNGVFISNDMGNTWNKLLPNTEFYTLRFKDEKTLFLAGKEKIAFVQFY